MRRTGAGSIILMSSLAGLRGAPTLAGYCATKGGVRLFAQAIAMECASVGDGIRVNSVHPGIIDTPIWGKIPREAAGSGTNAPIDPESILPVVVMDPGLALRASRHDEVFHPDDRYDPCLSRASTFSPP
jgi:NAD(P)-dependent dehydrogenase (short-subunit alcohol dehydrogenase family)